MKSESNRINQMECDMAEVKTEIRNITKNQEASKIENTEAHNEIKRMIKEFTDAADNKYASKTTEKLVYGLVALILTIVASAIIYMAIIK
jgi:subtilase family serine protease